MTKELYLMTLQQFPLDTDFKKKCEKYEITSGFVQYDIHR